MSFLTDLATINARFFDTWDDSVPVVAPDDTDTPESSSLWARFTVRPQDEKRVTIGSKRYRNYGRVYLQIMIPAGDAHAQGWSVADAFNNTFREWRSADNRIRFGTSKIETFDNEDEYYIVRVSLPYEIDD